MKVFSSPRECEKFFEKIGSETLTEGVEYKVFDGYEKSRVLIVVPHAGIKRFKVKIRGKDYWVRVGELYVDKLAKIAAFDVKGCFLVSYIPRDVADFARRPKDLGKDLRLRVYARSGESRKRIWLRIHGNKSYKQTLKKFHEFIEELDPKFILSFHGMRRTEFDAILGFGKNKSYIGGKRKAFLFRKLVSREAERLSKRKLRVGIAKFTFPGESEAVLNLHTKGRRGALVEFNYRERMRFSKSYQYLAIAIARVASRWEG